MKYMITAEIKAVGPIQDVVAALQKAFDNGADGAFEVIVTMAPTYIVIFERESAGDEEYVRRRATDDSVSVEVAAMKQVAAELVDGDVGMSALQVVNVLSEGDGQYFDFGNGSLEAMTSGANGESTVNPAGGVGLT